MSFCRWTELLYAAVRGGDENGRLDNIATRRQETGEGSGAWESRDDRRNGSSSYVVSSVKFAALKTAREFYFYI